MPGHNYLISPPLNIVVVKEGRHQTLRMANMEIMNWLDRKVLVARREEEEEFLIRISDNLRWKSSESKEWIFVKDPKVIVILTLVTRDLYNIHALSVFKNMVTKMAKGCKIVLPEGMQCRKCKTKCIQSVSSYTTSGKYSATVTTFKAESCRLKAIDRKILSIAHLSELNLSKNNIKTIPDALGDLNLTYLNLSENRLGSGLAVWEAFRRGVKYTLKSLDLSNNKLTRIDPVLQNCRKLVELNVSNNDFRFIPGGLFSHKNNLRKLNMTGNRYTLYLPFLGERRLFSLSMENEVEPHSVIRASAKDMKSLYQLSAQVVLYYNLATSEKILPLSILRYLDDFVDCTICFHATNNPPHSFQPVDGFRYAEQFVSNRLIFTTYHTLCSVCTNTYKDY